jgi:hypothetical protein
MELIEDLKKISLLDDQSYQQVIGVMVGECETLEWNLVVKNISKKTDGESVKAFIRFLNFLSENVSESRNYSNQVEEIDGFLTKLLNDESEALVSWERIKSSLSELESFFLQKKEDGIKDKFSRITGFKVVTDIRPIFSMDKKNISKLTYPYILKIETCDGKEFLCEFYEDTIDKIIEELQVAKGKLELIKDSYGRN